MPLVPYRSYALISREQIARNYRSARAAAGPGVAVMGVVKADAYGHGAVEVARVLAAEGVECFPDDLACSPGIPLSQQFLRTPHHPCSIGHLGLAAPSGAVHRS